MSQVPAVPEIEIPPHAGGPREHFSASEAWEGDVVAIAQGLAEWEFEPFVPLRLGWLGDGRTDAFEVYEEIEEYARYGSMTALAGAYVSAELWGQYEDLDLYHTKAFDLYFTVLTQRLSAHYGEPERNGEYLYEGDQDQSAVWRVGDDRLILQQFSSYGDGDFEFQLWLALVADPPEPEGE